MDLYCVHMKTAATTTTNLTCLRNLIPEKSPQSINNSSLFPSKPIQIHDLSLSWIGLSSKRYCKYPFLPRAMGGKKNPHNSDSPSSSSGDNDQSNSGGDGLKGSNPSPEKSHIKPLDWREFRALLYMNEQAEVSVSETHKQEKSSFGSKGLPAKWAHPLSTPEDGCLLVATKKLDGVRTFERTVILLLSSGTRNRDEGPFGIVINRPLDKKIKHMKPDNPLLATTFADCSLHFGGPLEASMFLLKAGEFSKLTGFDEVIPGVCFASRDQLDAAGGLIKKGKLKPQDFRFFFGYAGWQFDQLREEIDSEYWYVAASSIDLLFSISQNSTSDGLWEEVLQLMGGHYSESSRKPKQDT